MILGIIQARFSSTRLPGKVLKPILAKPMLELQIERVLQSKKIEKLVVATSNEVEDDVIKKLCTKLGVDCFRGSLIDVLDRFYQAAIANKPKHVVRLTGDCPLSDPEVIDRVIEFHLTENSDYTTNAIEPTFPDGLDVEVCTIDALKDAWKEAVLPSQREHVTPFIYDSPLRYKIKYFKNLVNLSALRWTVDDSADFELVKHIFEGLYKDKPNFNMNDILSFLNSRPELGHLNDHSIRNEGYRMSLEEDKFVKRYAKSVELLERALKTIPLGSQTFSKSKTQYPQGVSPFFIEKGKGSHVWDVDQNEYIDFSNSLCAVNLGYCDPDVDATVSAQLKNGVIFTLPHILEMQVAEKIVEMVPCAELVRFGKNGSDATTGAIRLARAYTNREHVGVCGYHGWQDWYIGTTARNKGVPKATQALSHPFTFNDIESAKKIFSDFPDQIAALILEPMNVTPPTPGYLEALKELTHKNGALLIFDETITGFRYANGGAQELFGVTPDLATFGKGMANGFPISAVAGKKEVMKLMEEIFFSFTFGGETLSLAAALATMTKLQKEPVIETIYKQGTKILKGVNELIQKHSLSKTLEIKGNPTWSFLVISDTAPYSMWQIKTLFFQEVYARGILTTGSHNLSFAHSDSDIAQLLKVYDEVFGILSRGFKNNEIEKLLCCKPLEPLFKIR
jgi:glutamate-1-semialdehyde aminotransferase/spore coat polysaccharide biosynthesis protein SpsF (cytidylyltransferase family)